MAKIGYIRVSTLEQHLDRQQIMMDACQVDRIYSDKQSGKDLNRPGFQALMAALQPGDELYVESFSRLSRSAMELLQTVRQLEDMQVSLHSQKEQIDTSTPTGKMMMTILAALAEFERDIDLERQSEGIEAAKARGVYKGGTRKPDSPQLIQAIKSYKQGLITAREAVQLSGVSRATFFSRCKQYQTSQQSSQ